MRGALGPVLGAVMAAGVAAGLVLLVMSIRGVTPDRIGPPPRITRLVAQLRSPDVTGRIAAGVVVGVLALVLIRWPVAAVGLVALVIFWPQMFGGSRLEQARIRQLEALVIWTESLRDTITARASLEQAITATAATAPGPIRPALLRLTGLVRARISLESALLTLSAELNDASADKVIGSLILNTRQRGSGLATVLSSLAAAGRAELDQQRRISAGRASMRRSVQLVVAITIGFAVFLAIFSRAYVAPYASAGGQLALTVVVGLFGVGFAWMRSLAGGKPAAPFLTRPGQRLSTEDLRVIAHLTGLTPDQAAALATTSSAGKMAGVVS